MYKKEDAKFIAAARTAIPKLIAHIRRQDECIAELREWGILGWVTTTTKRDEIYARADTIIASHSEKPCEKCGGHKATFNDAPLDSPESEVIECAECGGNGWIDSAYMNSHETIDCPKCKGGG